MPRCQTEQKSAVRRFFMVDVMADFMLESRLSTVELTQCQAE